MLTVGITPKGECPGKWEIPRDIPPQTKRLLHVIDGADAIRNDPSFKVVRATSGILVDGIVKSRAEQEAKDGWTVKELIPFVARDLQEAVIFDRFKPNPENDAEMTFEKDLLNGSSTSSLSTLAILDALRIDKKMIMGVLSAGDMDRYVGKLYADEDYEKLTDDEKAARLAELAEQEAAKIEAERQRKLAMTAEQLEYERAIATATELHEKLLEEGFRFRGVAAGSVVDEKARQEPDVVRVMRADANTGENEGLAVYPSGLSVIDYLFESNPDMKEIAILRGAEVFGNGKVNRVSPTARTLYIR